MSSERLTKLHEAGFILKQRVGILMHHGTAKEIGSVVKLTLKGLKVTQGFHKINSKHLQPRPLNTAELYHDLLLFDVAQVLKQKHSGCEIKKKALRPLQIFLSEYLIL